MDLTYLHLSLNHIPVIGGLFGFLILLISVFARSKAATRVGLGLLVLSAAVAIPVYLTGESAEEVVEHLPGFSGAITEQHESAAALSLGLTILSRLLACAALLLTRMRDSRVAGILVMATLVASLITTASMARTANLGGQVRHTEIRADARNNGQTSETGTTKKSRLKDDDD